MPIKKSAGTRTPLHPALDAESVKTHQERLRAASDGVDAAMREHGLVGAGERMICEDVIVIGPSGIPHHERRCHPIRT